MKIRRRKNFLPTFILTIFLWLAWLFILFFVSPETKLSTFYFLFSIFLALTFTFSLLFANSRRGFLVAAGFVLFLILRWQKLGNILNAVLLTAVILSLEVYFTKRK